jgi:hypothetical protein
LLSEPVRLPRGSRLSLLQSLDIDTPGGDLAEVGYWDEDSGWVVLAAFTGRRFEETHVVELDDLAGKTVRLGFRLSTDAVFDSDGWQILDASLSGSFDDCVGSLLREAWPGEASVLDFLGYQQSCLIGP